MLVFVFHALVLRAANEADEQALLHEQHHASSLCTTAVYAVLQVAECGAADAAAAFLLRPGP